MFHGEPKFWGATSMGERGQVVIPAKARNFLKIKKGDKLLVVSKGDKLLGLLKVDEISGFLKKWLKKLDEIKEQ
jgi:AbrB family looped-hinge helix DNA binding protein